MTFDPHKVKGVIWDLDNTLYRFTDELKHACNRAAAQAAKSQGFDLSDEETLKIAERSEEEHGYSLHVYITDHGLFYADLHIPFHEAIDETVISSLPDMERALQSFDGRQVILTNASRSWANRTLQFLGLQNYFSEETIVPMEDVNFEPKARSKKGFEKALSILNLPAENVMMVDDLDRNLLIPYGMGMQTIYMHYDDPMIDLPDFVTAQYEDAIKLMQEF